MNDDSVADEPRRGLERILAYAEGMMRHYEAEGFGEARSWRVVVTAAARALGVDDPPAPTVDEASPPSGALRDDELDRLLRHCRTSQLRGQPLVLSEFETRDLLALLCEEVLLWRRSHPGRLPR